MAPLGDGFWSGAGVGGNLGMQKSIVFTIAIALAANAQRIETKRSDRHKVIRVESAPNHLSIIELAEPAIEVATGRSSYKIEWLRTHTRATATACVMSKNFLICWDVAGALSDLPRRRLQSWHRPTTPDYRTGCGFQPAVGALCSRRSVCPP